MFFYLVQDKFPILKDKITEQIVKSSFIYSFIGGGKQDTRPQS
jgi:hypothetical protein